MEGINALIYAVSKNIHYITPLFMIFLFVLSPTLRRIVKEIANLFIDKGGKETFPDEEEFFHQKEKDIKKIIREELIKLAESEKLQVDIIKEKINAALKTELEEILEENQSNINFRQVAAAKIANETHILVSDILDNTEAVTKINEKYQIRAKEKNKENLLNHIDTEYSSARKTKQLMSNLFIVINFFYFIAMIYLFFSSLPAKEALITDAQIPTKLVLAISSAYLGFGAFIIYMIKFCNSRTLTLLSLREEMTKKDEIIAITNNLFSKEVNENHVAIMKIITANYSLREQATKHPYELLFNGIKDSNIVFKAGKFELTKDKAKGE